MVNIIDVAKAIHQIEEIIDVGNNVFLRNRAVFIWQVAVIADNLVDRTIRFFNKSDGQSVSGKYTAFLDFLYFSVANFRFCRYDDFPCFRIDNRFMQSQSEQAALPSQFLASLIAAYAGHIIAAGIKEESFKKIAGAFYRRWFTRTQFFINFYKGFIL